MTGSAKTYSGSVVWAKADTPTAWTFGLKNVTFSSDGANQMKNMNSKALIDFSVQESYIPQ